MTLVVRVYDNNKKRFVYTHETEAHTITNRKELEAIYNDHMTARFIITLAALHNSANYELFHPFAFHVDEECDYATITYIVKEIVS